MYDAMIVRREEFGKCTTSRNMKSKIKNDKPMILETCVNYQCCILNKNVVYIMSRKLKACSAGLIKLNYAHWNYSVEMCELISMVRGTVPLWYCITFAKGNYYSSVCVSCLWFGIIYIKYKVINV